MKRLLKEKCLKKAVSLGVVVSMVLSGMVSLTPERNYAYADSGYNLYFGNLHAHTSYSDGTGTPEEAFKHMKESKVGDFGAITDHSKHLTRKLANWEKTKELQDKHTDENFVAIAGCEILLDDETGEMCTYNVQNIIHEVDAPEYYDWLTQNDNSIAQFNQPKARDNEFYEFEGWSEKRNEHVKLLEYSNAARDTRYLSSYIKALNAGWKIAPAANSDTHEGDWLTGCDNRTVVLAKSLTRENIFDAIRNRRVYATEDKDLRISYTINGEVMGQILYNPAWLEFNIDVQSPRNNIKKIELYADGNLIRKQSYSQTCANWAFGLIPSYGYYFVRVTMEDGKTAVTAPIWIDKTGQESESNTLVPRPISQIQSPQSLGEKVFAPYLHLGSGNPLNVNTVYSETSQPYYIFAFMNSNDGTPAWRAKYNYDDGCYDDEIEKLRQSGGDIIISFGGASQQELGAYITDVTELQQAYQKVIDRFNLTWMDLDIEGSILRDTNANARRNKALVGLEKDNPNLVISYCLPADPRGLSSAALDLLQDAVKQGVRVDVVNLMAMDYGARVVPDPEGRMGYYAIETAKQAKKQLEEMGLEYTKIGITAMIGVNGVTTEVFRVNDAKELLEWAKQTDWVRLLSFWSVNRDNGDGSEGEIANSRNSSISQSLYEFTNIFKEFNKKEPSTTDSSITEPSTMPTTEPQPSIQPSTTPTTNPLTNVGKANKRKQGKKHNVGYIVTYNG